jgi:hypothetical protein
VVQQYQSIYAALAGESHQPAGPVTIPQCAS